MKNRILYSYRYMLIACCILSATAYGRVSVDKYMLVKNLLMMEPYITNDTISVVDFYSFFDFKLTIIEEDLVGDEDAKITYYVLDSFEVKNKKIINEDILKNKEYVIAIEGNMVYRIKGFSVNDFPFLLKRYLESNLNQGKSVNDVIANMNATCNFWSEYVDFDCLYDAFRSKEINYDKHPCLESVWHKQNVYFVRGYNNTVWLKRGGEPLGYRKTKPDKKYLVK